MFFTQMHHMPIYCLNVRHFQKYVCHQILNLILKNCLAVLTDHEICDLQEIQYQEKLQCGPGVPVKSHLREWIKVSIRRIQETGLMAYHWKIWMGHQPKCENNDRDVQPVDIVHFSSAIYGLVIGMQISFGFLMAEIITVRYPRGQSLT